MRTDPTLGYLIEAVVAAAWLIGYLLVCFLWPFKACRKCGGAARHRSPTGKAFRLCRRCGGTGRRLRFGRKAWNFYRRLRSS